MNEQNATKHLIIHGHFYQPPRENPWTGRIDRQEGAAPYHDWNERIAVECYNPNILSRRLDGYGRITKMVNNYEWISFNFGPTLMAWLEERYPETYEKIIEADRLSAARLGRGNAIAQAYNHVIMPLATVRDQETQIRWGVADFERRFGREPEGIWLPETAINDTTLAILIDFGFRFIILSPHQAAGIRPLTDGGRWKDVSNGSIPAGVPYRCHERGRRGRRRLERFIDIFFYDASLSVDVSFNHLLRNGDSFADTILDTYGRGGDLAVIATDGEIYGHHEPFADMALSYLADVAAPVRGITMTNFGAYLDTHAPAHEVRLKSGRDGEGTAWSCGHGVGRWKEDCGCNSGAPPAWNQRWRDPLRRGLDALGDALDELFEREAADIFGNPWSVRDEYIAVIADRRIETVERFVDERASRELTPEERTHVLTLLESQRFSQLMFTSCGWFFNDISGIEAVQLLRYAARAIGLAGAAHRDRLEQLLLGILAEARSNVPEAGTGADVYRRAVADAAVDTAFIAAQHAIFAHLFGIDEASSVFMYTIRTTDHYARLAGDDSLSAGRVEIISPYTLERTVYRYLVTVEDNIVVRCRIRPESAGEDFSETAERLGPEAIPDERLGAEIARVADEFGGRRINPRDLFLEDRERILEHLCGDTLERVADQYLNLYEDNRGLLRLLRETSITPPRSLSAPAEIVLTRKLVQEVARWKHTPEPEGLDGIREIVTEAENLGVRIDTTSAARAFHDLIVERLVRLEQRLDADTANLLYEFVELSHALDIEVEMHDIQNTVYRILETTVNNEIERIGAAGGTSRDAAANAIGDAGAGDDAAIAERRRTIESFLKLARRFNFNTDSYQERLS